MFVFLSKFLPQLVYPLCLACILIIGGLIFPKKRVLRSWLLGGALFLLIVGGNRWVSTSLARSLEVQVQAPQAIPPADVIVVLGGGTESYGVPRTSVELNGAGDRVLYAARLYRDGIAPRLLLSGGDRPPRGVRARTPPPDAQEGVDRVVLVTSAAHMPRSKALFEKQGIDVIPAPADYSVPDYVWQDLWRGDTLSQVINLVPNVGSLSQTTSSLKEYFGLWMYRLRGWL